MIETLKDIRLRPIREPEDMLLLQHIFATSRDYETQAYGFPEPDLTRFLTHQFLLQHHQYMATPDAQFYIIESLNGDPLGRFYLRQMPYPEIRVMDIAVLPAHRGKGIGKQLFKQIMDQAEKKGQRVSIHVDQNNPSHGFYENLGFGFVQVDGIYDLMVWPARQTPLAKEAQQCLKKNPN
ncbi:MAG: GNAT family N-acetyltransferase [Proteobacteria bacterium]|nr:GNAT family N-acetyltransferase [Pseudomonadota bacterium]